MELYPSNLIITTLSDGTKEGFNPDYKKQFFMRETEAQNLYKKLSPIFNKLYQEEISFKKFLQIKKIFLIIDGEKK